jgi:hypothetical protein
MYVLERIPGITIVVATVVRSFAAQPVDRPVSLGAKSMRASILSLFNASTRRAHSGPFFPPRKPRNSGRICPSPVPLPAVGMVVLEPFQGVFGGTENSPAPNDPKLGRLRRTRQGLVRVPESNTKYGGKPGKPGVAGRPLMPQVSVSPRGIPSEKNLREASIRGCARCSQGKYFL